MSLVRVYVLEKSYRVELKNEHPRSSSQNNLFDQTRSDLCLYESASTRNRADILILPNSILIINYNIGYIQRSAASTVSLGLVLKDIFEDGGAF